MMLQGINNFKGPYKRTLEETSVLAFCFTSTSSCSHNCGLYDTLPMELHKAATTNFP